MTSCFTLDNGVRVIADPMPGLETVALGVWVRAGSMDERDDEHGVAHLLEHMAFKGTKTRTARALAEEIESAGGYMNAATSHQRTGYYARMLKDDLALGAEIIADILQNPLFDEAELTKEHEVVVQEIGEVADTPDDVVFELLQAASWDGHPLARHDRRQARGGPRRARPAPEGGPAPPRGLLPPRPPLLSPRGSPPASPTSTRSSPHASISFVRATSSPGA